MLKMSKYPCQVTIFEGPDGSGKTTLAKEFAKRTGALYVHFEAYYAVKDIHKFFIEAMQPALMGYQNVVLDRCWHSGPIYDMMFRNLEVHEQRQTPEICMLLDRAAAHCKALMVNCRPPEEVCINNWASRIESELVKSEFKMRGIWNLYGDIADTTILPCLEWDYGDSGNTMDSLIARTHRERMHHYKGQSYVHYLVSSGAKATRDVMIDIPGVRFDEHSNEYKLAQMFGFNCHVKGQDVMTEELVKFLPLDTDLFEYFNRNNHSHETQYVIAVGDEAISKFMSFKDANGLTDKDTTLVSNINFMPIHDIVADTYIRDIQCLDSLVDITRGMYENIVTSQTVIPYRDGEDNGSSPSTHASSECGAATSGMGEAKSGPDDQCTKSSGAARKGVTVVVIEADSIDDIVSTISGGTQ